MKARVEVKNADSAKRSLEALINNLGDNTQVLIGVQKGAGNYDDGLPLAVVAAANHFGANLAANISIPARPFLDVAIEKNQRKYSVTAKNLLPKVLEGEMEMDQLLDSIGLQAASDVQEFMVELKTPPNAPRTVKKKGSSNPLIDSGHLVQSIRHEIAREPVEEGLS